MFYDIIRGKENTLFPSVRPTGPFWEGTVDIVGGAKPRVMVHTCLGVRDTPEEALIDAVVDALQLCERL